MRGQHHAPAASTPGKDPVSILQEAGWAPGPVCAGGISHSHRDSILNRVAPSQSLYRLSYPAHTDLVFILGKMMRVQKDRQTDKYVCKVHQNKIQVTEMRPSQSPAHHDFYNYLLLTVHESGPHVCFKSFKMEISDRHLDTTAHYLSRQWKV